MMHTLFPLMVSHKSYRLSLFLFILFPFCSPDWIVSLDMSSTSLILLLQICWSSPLNPSLTDCILQLQNFSLLLFFVFFLLHCSIYSCIALLILLHYFSVFLVALWASLVILNSWAISAFLWGLSLEVYYIPLTRSCFPNSLWFLQPCTDICTFKEAMTPYFIG